MASVSCFVFGLIVHLFGSSVAQGDGLAANPVRSKIQHFVVLMLENRSFDTILGFLKNDNSDINGLTGKENNPYNTSDPNSPVVFVNDDAPYVDPDPDHSVGGTTEQCSGELNPLVFPVVPPMDGFVQNAQRNGFGPKVMSCFNKTTVPVINTLASEFVLFDHYYASVPGPTQVNRMYLHSGTSHGDADNNEEHMVLGYPQKTIYENMHEGNFSWANYFQEVPSTYIFGWIRRPENLPNLRFIDRFYEDAANGTLPNLSFIDPRYFDLPAFPASDQHPSHNMVEGELLIKRIYEALRASPLWEKSALIVTYDEHGGFYDHQPTPTQGVPNPDGRVCADPAFNFTRIGVRVPFVVASPWVDKGVVVHEASGPTNTSQYEHSSLSATLRSVFGLPFPLTRRDEWASPFDAVFNRTFPRTDCPEVLPSPPVMPQHGLNEGRGRLSALQKEFLFLSQQAFPENPLHKTIDPDTVTEAEAGCYINNEFARLLGRPLTPTCFV